MYLIYEEYGDPYDHNEWLYGYTDTEEEAKSICDKHNAEYAKFDVEAFNEAYDKIDDHFENTQEDQYEAYDMAIDALRKTFGYKPQYEYAYYEWTYTKIEKYKESS